MINKTEKVIVKSINAKALVLYRFPNKKKINLIKGVALACEDFSKVNEGFIIQSFDGKKKYWIKADGSPNEVNSFIQKSTSSTSKSEFLSYVRSIQSAIKGSKLTKVVAARSLSVNRPPKFDAFELFNKALHYKEAFVSLVYIENECCWLCASPELFLKTSDNEIQTYSLAGTLKESIDFGEKELIEQGIVTSFIVDTLQSFKQLKKPTLKSKIIANGLLNHLLTTVKSVKRKSIHWSKIATKLHPTPAVCGYPFSLAEDVIAKNEKTNRAYYSGFLGEIKNGNARLYVNLRCMEVTQKNLIFYAGCGITKDSKPLSEWEETNHKINVMFSLLKSKSST